ncbi:Conserved_hypothetical protein [Hexamita inflata]|uniref:DUF5874 domain-containing protein n=1 Tax=Hexamita inflata TaxID=28002 RepID=A0ABP1JEL6_9EUKA
MLCLLNVYVLQNEQKCVAGFSLVEEQCQCLQMLSSDRVQCVSRCADVNESVLSNNFDQSSNCVKCDVFVHKDGDNHCVSVQEVKILFALKQCGTNAKPNPQNCYQTCICNDSSLVLQADGINCKCPSNTYFNSYERTCLSCSSGSPDATQTFCVCPTNSDYFDQASKQCITCASGATQSSLNQCICTTSSRYDMGGACTSCAGGATSSTADRLTCSCASKVNMRFDEEDNSCLTCGVDFSSTTYKDRSTCVCIAAGKVNINNVSCQVCGPGSVIKSSALDGCQCTDSSFFWSPKNNTCTRCPFGIADADNKCVCPPNSQLDNMNNSCICYGNYYFDGHNCVSCPINYNVVDGVCRFNSSANPYCIQQTCPQNAVPNANNTNCVCSGNFFYTNSNNSCTPCPGGSVVTNNVCSTNQFQGVQPSAICGLHAKPNTLTGNLTCICNDSSLVLLSDQLNCKCPDTFYFNFVFKTCLQCPSGSSPDGTKTFCVCLARSSYFDPSSKSCTDCPSGGSTSLISNQCTCILGRYNKGGTCTSCAGGATLSTVDRQSCSCYSKPIMRFNETKNSCVACGTAFAAAITYNDRSTCVCGTIGEVNINNATCEPCGSGSVSKNPGVQNVDGCQCTNSSYFWSAVNNTCTLCAIGIADSENKCVCPPNSQLNNAGTACVCNANYVLDGNNCVKEILCPANSSKVNNVCTCTAISGQQMVNGACECINANALVQGAACVCPTYSTLVGDTCSCPANSHLASGACACDADSFTLSTNGGVLTCQVCPATASPDAGQTTCVCQSGQVFDSAANQCSSCPANSSKVNNVCTCNVVSGQQMANGACECINANSVVQGSSCVCPTYSTLVGSICTCPGGSHLQSSSCVCDAGSLPLSTNIYYHAMSVLFGSLRTPVNNLCSVLLTRSSTPSANSCISLPRQSSLVINVAPAIKDISGQQRQNWSEH